MPSKTPAQKKLMMIAAHTKGGYGGVPQSVGREFYNADKGKNMKRGGKIGSMPALGKLSRGARPPHSGPRMPLPAMVGRPAMPPDVPEPGAGNMPMGVPGLGGGMKKGGRVNFPQHKVAGEHQGGFPEHTPMMASGGAVASRDGVASQGSTKGKVC